MSPGSSEGSGIGEINWKTIRHGRNVFQVKIPTEENNDWEWWCLLTADRHWDNPHSNHDLQREHLEQALQRGAAVCDLGDFYCAMNTRGDKRASKAAIRPEHKVDNYLDALGTTAAEWFAPYAKNFVVIATGNHEAAVNKFCEVNLVERLVCLLNAKTGSTIFNGGFSGWVVFTFEGFRNDRTRNTQVVLHFDHGYGGGGAVTKDMIQASRRAVYLPDADIVASGHVHEFWQTPFARVRLNRHDFSLRHDRQMHIRIPTYKEEYRDGFSGWHPERGGPPKVTGAVWLRFFWSHKENRVLYEVIEAR